MTSNSWLPTRTVLPIGFWPGNSRAAASSPINITSRPKLTSALVMPRPRTTRWL